MDVTDQILKNKQYDKQISEISNENLRIIAENHIRALEEARKGIKLKEPDKNDNVDYLEYLADGMQKLAQKVLEKRKKKNK